MVERDTFVTVADGDQLNDGYFNAIAAEGAKLAGLNTIRQLQDRSITFNQDNVDFFGDAFIDVSGRVDSVNTGSTTATFDSTNLSYGVASASEELVYLDIPQLPTTFGSAITTAIGIPLYYTHTSAGGLTRYKLINSGGDDSGWLTVNELSTFTAFSNGQPDQIVIGLADTNNAPTNPITNPSFEDDIAGNWTYVEGQDTNNVLSGTGRVTDMPSGETGTFSIQISKTNNYNASADNVEYSQYNVDFSNIETLSIDTQTNLIRTFETCLIIDDGVTEVILDAIHNTTNKNTLSGTIPLAYRKSGISIHLRVVFASTGVSAQKWWFDNLLVGRERESIKGFVVRAT